MLRRRALPNHTRYENFAFAQPYQHCMFHESLTLEAVRFDYPSRIAALKPLTVVDLAAFVPGIYSNTMSPKIKPRCFMLLLCSLRTSTCSFVTKNI